MEKEEYGQSLKTIRFSVTDDDHARLLISLRNNNLPASQFFRAVIDGMIEKNPDILSFVDNYVLEHKLLNRNRFAKSARLRKKGQENIEDYGLLDDSDKEKLFDLIAEEFPEL